MNREILKHKEKTYEYESNALERIMVSKRNKVNSSFAIERDRDTRIQQQNDIARQQANTAAKYLQQQAEQSAKMDQGFADVAAAILNGFAGNTAAINALATQQAEAAAQAQAKWDQSQRASAANLTDPHKIDLHCGGRCVANNPWMLYMTNVTNNDGGRTNITIWRCSGGNHFCASDKGNLGGWGGLSPYRDQNGVNIY